MVNKYTTNGRTYQRTQAELQIVQRQTPGRGRPRLITARARHGMLLEMIGAIIWPCCPSAIEYLKSGGNSWVQVVVASSNTRDDRNHSALFAQARAVAPGPGRVLTDDPSCDRP